MTVWYFLVDDNDRVRRAVMNEWSRLWREETVPEYVGIRRLRHIQVCLHLRNRKPVGEPFGVSCGVLELDGTGRLDEEKHRAFLHDVVNSLDLAEWVDWLALPALVVDARKTFAERALRHRRSQHDAKYKWKPSEEVWAQVWALSGARRLGLVRADVLAARTRR